MFEQVSQTPVAIREGLALFRELRPGKDRDVEEQRRADQLFQQLELQINQASQTLEYEKLRLAKHLGYQTCQCTFPPQIVLKEPGGHRYLCQRCKTEYPDHRSFGVEILR